MGFKPKTAMKAYNVRTADFIYPDDSVRNDDILKTHDF
jgi:hypothetical protein